MHEPHSSGVCRITHFVRVEVVMISGIYRLGLSVWFTPETERVIVLSKILALNKSLALLLSVLLAASVGTITVEQYRRIRCHTNFVKAKDASSRVRDRSWNMTLKDFVGYYKFWNEVIVWFMQMIFYNVYIPLQMRRRKIQVLYNISYH